MKNLHLLLLFSLISLIFLSCTSKGNTDPEIEKSEVLHDVNSVKVNVEETWELPEILKEVSGIAFIEDNLFACVQDEDGKIFIYNTSTSKIEKEIYFAGEGDYEAIALTEKAAYVVRSDGKIFKIEDWKDEKPIIAEFDTPLTEEDNVEGLVYDKQNKQLLLAAKDGDKGNKGFKNIYAFDLGSNKLDKEPELKIDPNDPLLSSSKEKKKAKRLRPSEIGIHPVTREIYITDGPTARLLIMDWSGAIQHVIQLDEAKFPQPEGLTFNASGDMFISNEGKDGKGNILKVVVLQQEVKQ